jgi:hypothetical protein
MLFVAVSAVFGLVVFDLLELLNRPRGAHRASRAG